MRALLHRDEQSGNFENGRNMRPNGILCLKKYKCVGLFEKVRGNTKSFGLPSLGSEFLNTINPRHKKAPVCLINGHSCYK